MNTDSPQKTVLTTIQAGIMLGYTRQHIGYLVRQGDLQGETIGRDILVTYKSVSKYLNKYEGKHRKPGRKPAGNHNGSSKTRKTKEAVRTDVSASDNETLTEMR